jgi:hypothetical protein
MQYKGRACKSTQCEIIFKKMSKKSLILVQYLQKIHQLVELMAYFGLILVNGIVFDV